MMYVNYWNLKTNPFANTVEPPALQGGDQYEEAVARLFFIAESGRLPAAITGPHGVGKTTVLHQVAQLAATRHIPVIRVAAIPGGELEIARYILQRMAITAPDRTLPETLLALAHAAEHESQALARTLLCIDDAHYLAPDTGFHLMRFLTDLFVRDKTGKSYEPLFTLLLAGTDNLLEMLRNDESLSPRFQMYYALKPLSREASLTYVQDRLRAAGGDMWVFNEEAIEMIYRYSSGLPRRINALCDTALMLGYSARAPHIDAGIVTQAGHALGVPTAPVPPTLHPHPETSS